MLSHKHRVGEGPDDNKFVKVLRLAEPFDARDEWLPPRAQVRPHCGREGPERDVAESADTPGVRVEGGGGDTRGGAAMPTAGTADHFHWLM